MVDHMLLTLRRAVGALTVPHGRSHVTGIAQSCLTLRADFLIAGVIKEVMSWL